MWLLLVVCVFKVVAGEVVLPWWNNAVYYRVLVDSFKDSDGDGLGDLQGAIKQISYVRALGADAVILSSLSAKSTDCTKPGIVDFIEIDQRYGNLQSFSGLIEKIKKLELKVVLTLQMQSVSITSEWFTSSADRVAGFDDRFIWKDGNVDEPPAAEEGVDSWIWHDTRNSFYAVVNGEALLNLCSESVMAALCAAQCAWLRRGISGVLLHPDYPKDQRCGEQLLQKMAAEAMSCVRSANLDTPVILVETSLRPEIASRYYSDGGAGANSILSRALTSKSRSSAAELAIAFHSGLLTAPQDATPTWLTSTANGSRITTRYGTDMVDTINLLALVLPGAVVIQQGDELGVADTLLEWATSTTCWPGEAVPSAAPFPWDETTNGGFSTGEPWLPIAPNYRYANAKTEFANDYSHVGVVRLAAAMRKSPANGPHVEISRLNGALAVLRWGGSGTLLVVTNPTRDQTEAQLSTMPGLPPQMTVAISSAGSSLSTGSHMSIDKTLKLGPGESVLFAGGPRHCGGPGPVDKITNKLSEGWQKINKYFSSL